jgi:hypothetical protein
MLQKARIRKLVPGNRSPRLTVRGSLEGEQPIRSLSLCHEFGTDCLGQSLLPLLPTRSRILAPQNRFSAVSTSDFEFRHANSAASPRKMVSMSQKAEYESHDLR